MVDESFYGLEPHSADNALLRKLVLSQKNKNRNSKELDQ